MSGARIKNIIILILAVANLFLLVLVVSREGRDARYQAEALRSAVHILQEEGIAVSENALAAQLELTPCLVERDRAGEARLAAALLGTVSEEERGGGVYRYVGQNGTGSIQFHSSGEFYAVFAAGTFPLGESRVEEHAAEVMRRLEFDGEVVAVATGRDGGVTVTVRQRWEGVPVYSCTASLRYEGGELRSISDARRINGIPETRAGEKLMSVPTVLMRFLTEINSLGDVCSEIVSLEGGYTFTASLSQPASLEPVWQIRTGTGTYEMDAATGAFSRVELSGRSR